MLKNIAIALTLTALTTLAFGGERDVFELDQVKWQPAGLEGAEMAVLWGSEADGNAIWAFRLQPGVVIPPHTHSKDYWGFAIQGQWAHIDSKGRSVVTKQNSYVHVRADETHSDRCIGPEVCVNIIDFDGARDIIFPEVAKKH